MVAEPVVIPERDFRGPGCDDRCYVLRALIPGVFGRSALLVHDPAAHEEYGRSIAHVTGTDAHTVVTGRLTVNLASLEVTVDGQRIHLSARETALLVTLARRPGQTIEYLDLVRLAWGSEYAGLGKRSTQALVKTALGRLRGRLGQAGWLIVTVINVGLRLDVLPPGAPAREPLVKLGAPLLGDRWAREWPACRQCGLTDLPHTSHGYCERCRSQMMRAGRWGPESW